MKMNQINLETVLVIWWAFIWRAAVFGGLVGFFLGFIGGVIVFITGASYLGPTIGGILGWLGSIPVSIWAMSKAIRMNHNGFHIEIVKSDKSAN